MSKTEIVEKKEMNYNTLIEIAMEKGDLEKIEKYMDLKIKWEANEAKKAFVRAMSEFKSTAPTIYKDKTNKQYGSKYVSVGNLINTVTPELSKHGLSARFELEQNGIIKVTCIVTHALGHSESTFAQAPADASGSKNSLQQIKSTITYLRIVTFENLLGIVSADGNMDDDGNAAGTDLISKEQLDEIMQLIIEKKVSEKKLCDLLKIDKLENMPANKYNYTLSVLTQKQAVKK
jgi:hypothetical protein